MGRSIKLYERIAKVVGVSNPQVTDVDIYDSLNDVQTQVAQRLLCIEKSGTLTVTSGVASVPTGFFRLKRIVMPDGTAIFPQEIDVQEYDTFEHLLFTNIANTVQYYKIWNSQITFFPTPANTTYTVFYYGIPTTTIVGTPTSASEVEPELPSYMDECLRYGALSDLLAQSNDDKSLAKASYYKQQYDEELSRLEKTWRKTKTVSNQIYYSDVM